jgi:hypothetical protein
MTMVGIGVSSRCERGVSKSAPSSLGHNHALSLLQTIEEYLIGIIIINNGPQGNKDQYIFPAFSIFIRPLPVGAAWSADFFPVVGVL